MLIIKLFMVQYHILEVVPLVLLMNELLVNDSFTLLVLLINELLMSKFFTEQYHVPEAVLLVLFMSNIQRDWRLPT